MFEDAVAATLHNLASTAECDGKQRNPLIVHYTYVSEVRLCSFSLAH